MPSASTVSRYMGVKFDRSHTHTTRLRGWHTYTTGFKVQASGLKEGLVIVEYIHGDQYRYASAELRNKVMADSLAAYQEYLKERYDVDISDGGLSTVLHVEDKT